MPKTRVVFYQDDRGHVPVLEWLETIPVTAMDKCMARIARLAEMGHELRRPTADYLEQGIYELRASHQGIHYRVLYFFHGREIAVLGHSLTKERRVPNRDLKLAVRRKSEFERDPAARTANAENMSAKKTTDALEIISSRFYKGDPCRQRSLDDERDNVYIAEQIYELRKAKGLTQKQLGDLIGTSSSVVSRLEHADYDGHSLTMLRRIADALDRAIRIEFVERKQGLRI